MQARLLPASRLHSIDISRRWLTCLSLLGLLQYSVKRWLQIPMFPSRRPTILTFRAMYISHTSANTKFHDYRTNLKQKIILYQNKQQTGWVPKPIRPPFPMLYCMAPSLIRLHRFKDTKYQQKKEQIKIRINSILTSHHCIETPLIS